MILQLLQETAERFPKRTAIIYKKLRISYEKLYSNIQEFTRAFSSLEIGQGDCVAFVLPNCPEWVYSFYAVAQLGGIVLPLNPLFQAEKLSYCIEDSDVKAVITDLKRAKICRQILAILDRDIELIVVDGIYSGAHYLYNLIWREQSQPRANRESEIDSEFILHQYYYPELPRKPQRISRTKTELYEGVKNFAETAQIAPSDKILCALPMSDSYGLEHCVLAATCKGATLVILEQVLQKDSIPVKVPSIFRSPRVLQLIQGEKINIFNRRSLAEPIIGINN